MTAPARILDRIFPSLAAGAFVAEHFPARPCAGHAAPERLGELAAWPAWDDLPALVEAIGGDAVIGYARAADGRPVQAVHPRERWRELHGAGATVELMASEAPRFRALCDEVAADLGLAASAVSADVFLSPRGEAVPKHFDGVDVIVLQLRGTKRWQLAANPDVAFPAHAYIPGFGPDIRNHRAADDEGPGSRSLEMPADAETIDLQPGSALFVPRGWWHRTTAITDSISISIVTRPPTTGELLRSLVDRAIRSRPAWREPVAGAAGRADALRARLSALLDELGPETAHLRTGAVEVRHFRRRAGVAIDVAVGRGEPSVVTIARRGEGATRMKVPDQVATLFGWVAAAPGRFRATDPAPLFPPGCGDWIEGELRTLEQMGVIEAV